MADVHRTAKATCPRCGATLTPLEPPDPDTGPRIAQAYRCEACGWLGDEEDRRDEEAREEEEP